jgi:hypothetical protein
MSIGKGMPSSENTLRVSLFPSHVAKRDDALRRAEPEHVGAFNRDTERTAKLQQRSRHRSLERCGWPHWTSLRSHECWPQVRNERNLNTFIRGRQKAHEVAPAVEDGSAACATWYSAFDSEARSREAAVAPVGVTVDNATVAALRGQLDSRIARNCFGAVACNCEARHREYIVQSRHTRGKERGHKSPVWGVPRGQ